MIKTNENLSILGLLFDRLFQNSFIHIVKHLKLCDIPSPTTKLFNKKVRFR